MNTNEVIGIMSGTSLDGVDLAHCAFDENKPGVFEIVQAETVSYDAAWKDKLLTAHLMRGDGLMRLHYDYSRLIANMVDQFRIANGLVRPGLLAFHGHTVYHQPKLGFTFQLGSGPVLATQSGIPVASDFRAGNVGIGGQGAPLVPIGDTQLFPEFEACMNIGGFANITLKNDAQIVAFDICAANMVLNMFAQKLGKAFDENGHFAAGGTIHAPTLDALNQLQYYDTPPPKSLGREWFEDCIVPVLDAAHLDPADVLATYCEHIALQTQKAIPNGSAHKVLVTGGGAHNEYLVSRIRHYLHIPVEVPNPTLVDFKEALVFAYMGWLRLRGETNCLANYTGARRDLCAGSLHLA